MTYNSGSLIYAKGDNADKVFILQNGKVSLVYNDIETGEDVRDQVQPGEFFGVKSALGRYPREENAIAVADSAIMVFTIPEFETMAMSNTRIILKMLKVFSNQLRRIHTKVSSLLETEPVKPDEGLYMLGEKYLKQKRYSHAKYVFSNYLSYYPDSEKEAQAIKSLKIAETSMARSPDANKAKAPAQNAEPKPAPAMEMAAFARFTQYFHTDEIIFCEHEPGNTFFFIQTGKVKIVKNAGDIERTIDILQPSEMFGEMAILESSPRTATAIAVEEVTALEFNAQNFEILLHGNPQIAFRLLRLFSKRIYDSKRRFVILTLPDLQAKIAYAFILLDDTQTTIDKSTNRREFKTTVDDIAQWAGLSINQTRDTMSHFVTQGRIEITSKSIIVKNLNDFVRLVRSRRSHV